MDNEPFLRSIQNVYFIVSDVHQSVEFYRQILGVDTQFIDQNRWAQFKIGAQTFALASPDEGGGMAGSGGVLTFNVDNLQCLRDQLVRLGTEILEERDMGAHGKTISIRDLDGNLVQFLSKNRS